MKAWPIDPLDLRSLKLEVSEKLPLELMLELVFHVCVRKKKRMGAGISGGGPPWAHEAGACLGG